MYKCIKAKLQKRRTQHQKDDRNFVRISYFKLWEQTFLQVFGGARVSVYFKEKTSINQVLIL